MSKDKGSQVFIGHRALGYVSNYVPLVVRYVQRRRENLIVTCVGRCFHTYGASKLGLLSVSNIHPEDITTMAADTYLVFTGAGNVIYAWRRGSELKHVYRGHEKTIRHLLPFGPTLISVDSGGTLKIWDIKTEELIRSVEFLPTIFDITAICHPNTYKDKILMGSSQGPLKIWNLKTNKQIYKFKGWDSPVTCLEPCPSVLDAVAIGLESGDIIVHNLKYDEEYVKFRQDWGPITALSFRSDRTDVLVSGSSSVSDEAKSGHIAIWDLNERKLAGQMRDAHLSNITGLHCLPGEPVLMSSSPDNTLKQWIFDLPDASGRLLRIKEGHAAPPTKIRFYGNLGQNILSASEDSSLRSFSTVTDVLNKSFGVASFNRKLSKKHKKIHNPTKMNPIIDFTTETTREEEWDNIVAVHDETLDASTWSFKKRKMGDLLLKHPRFKEVQPLRNSKATCVCLSACGNFVFIGYTTGHVDRFNVQSGIHRGEYSGKTGGPEFAIRGIVSDGLNQLVITASAGGILRFWRFSDQKMLCRPKDLGVSILQVSMHRESHLVAVVTGDFSVLVLDAVTRNMARKFESCHFDQITDCQFSSDSKWLLTSSLDSSVKVWDIPSGSAIDHIRFPKPVTSLTVAPRGEYLATTHVGDLGIYLWINKTLYGHVNLRPLKEDYEPSIIQMPTVSYNQALVEELEENVENMEVNEPEDEEMYDEDWTTKQIGKLITLSNLPSSRWQHLLKLDVIKLRNKPTNPVQKPVSAPFFLPTVTGLDGETKFIVEPKDDEEDSMKSRIISSSVAQSFERNYSEFGEKVWNHEEGGVEPIIGMLKEKGPSAIDIEIKNLAPEGGGSIDLMAKFLRVLKSAIESRFWFELSQSYLALFLKLHGDTILDNEELIKAVDELQDVLKNSLTELKGELRSSSTLVGFCKNSLVSA